ncbi:hypothetical protein SAY87_027597 [Trapa incisa]|uniref:Uncharacterized protein n=1 Tax=Trapa incisa TaxID=236973 RepID=A0AAN7JN15_9MYRT|nr:hypothetical protein SAY87_027597 [Trapa incisa]
MEAKSYTRDGTVDLRGRPVLAFKTGKWKACSFLVSFFNWWVFSSFLGGLFATLGLVYIQENLSWGLGYGVPTVGLILSLLVFYMGTPMYRHKVTTTSPTSDLIRVPFAAFKNRKLPASGDSSELHELNRQYYVAAGRRQLHHTPVFKYIYKREVAEVEPEVKQGSVLPVETKALELPPLGLPV